MPSRSVHFIGADSSSTTFSSITVARSRAHSSSVIGLSDVLAEGVLVRAMLQLRTISRFLLLALLAKMNPEPFSSGVASNEVRLRTDLTGRGCVGGKGLAQCLWLIEHRWRSEVAGQHKDYLMAVLWRTNHLTHVSSIGSPSKRSPGPRNAAGEVVADRRVHFSGRSRSRVNRGGRAAGTAHARGQAGTGGLS